MGQRDAAIPLAFAIDDFQLLLSSPQIDCGLYEWPFLLSCSFFIVFAFDILLMSSISASSGCPGTSPTAFQVQGDYS